MADTTTSSSVERSTGRVRFLPDMPLVIWMVLVTMALGFAGGLEANAFISTFNSGFGLALGEFALILLPSFVLAAALSRGGIASVGAERVAIVGAPVAGAGMICPDTAYAALSPTAGRRKLGVAFGAYTGFKLLYPAGPLIVATGLGTAAGGASAATLALIGVALALPVWATARFVLGGAGSEASGNAANGSGAGHGLIATLAPLSCSRRFWASVASSARLACRCSTSCSCPRGRCWRRRY